MNAKRIFCFWEPQGEMTPYLRLCMRTWTASLPDYEIIVLDHSNLDAYVPEGSYELDALRKLDWMLQKDAILVAVLKEHGGIFMDVDTLVTRDIAPIVQQLRHTEVVMFSLHLAFVTARPGSRLLTLWTKGIQERLARLGEAGNGTEARWDYLGNGVLDEVMTDMMSASTAGRAYEAIERRRASWSPWARAAWQRVCDPLWARRRGLFFRSVYRKHLRMLDRKRYGFIAEAAFPESAGISPAEQYRSFWFEERREVASVFHGEQRLIGLHNSWTPDWYKALSEKQVLEHDCLLSKTLRHLLER